MKSPCRWKRSTRPRRGRSRSDTGIRARCTCGGRGGRWRRRARSSSRRWWTIPRSTWMCCGRTRSSAGKRRPPSRPVGSCGTRPGRSPKRPKGPVSRSRNQVRHRPSTTCWPTRSASGSSASSRTSCCGRTPPTRRCCRRHATRSGRAGGAPAPRTPTIRGRRSYSTGISCPPSTIPSRAAARCRSRHSGSGSRPTPAT